MMVEMVEEHAQMAVSQIQFGVAHLLVEKIL